MTQVDQAVFDIIQASLWGKKPPQVDRKIYEELVAHTIHTLPAGILSSISMDPELRSEWVKENYLQVTHNVNYRYEQDALPISVPYAILKGTEAAQYYPHPEFRNMGDIDIITRREDFLSVCNMLIQGGYTEYIPKYTGETIRHRIFTKEDIMVEVHKYFAMFNDKESAEYVDNLIINQIDDTHRLPDFVNGIVFLEHISQHMEEGLGLRQIIDWMMFVHQCLPDEKWEEFRYMTICAGVEKLAIICTRMCEIFLGLPERAWSKEADEALCKRLMEYVLACGNFGNKREYKSFRSEKMLSIARSPTAIFTLLQRYGMYNWKSAKKHPILKPFAWLYQTFRYVRITFTRRISVKALVGEYSISRKRNKLFDDLGVTQKSKRLVVYEDGKYIKDHL